MRNLRLIANIEDPGYLLIAAKKGGSVTNLEALRNRKEPLVVLTDGGPWLQTVFEYYGITKEIVGQNGLLEWYNRPYSIDRHTIWRNGDIPLHPGAARYSREQGYIQ